MLTVNVPELYCVSSKLLLLVVKIRSWNTLSDRYHKVFGWLILRFSHKKDVSLLM